MFKRGLSEIVSTVLIVLLALVAVGVVWAFVNPLLKDASKDAELSAECLRVDVRPVSCTYTNLASNSNKLVVNAQAQNKGGGAVKIIGILNRKDGRTQANATVADTPILGTAEFFFGDGNRQVNVAADNPTNETYDLFESLSVAGVVRDEDGREKTCGTLDIACTYVPDCTPMAGMCKYCNAIAVPLSQSECEIVGPPCSVSGNDCVG